MSCHYTIQGDFVCAKTNLSIERFYEGVSVKTTAPVATPSAVKKLAMAAAAKKAAFSAPPPVKKAAVAAPAVKVAAIAAPAVAVAAPAPTVPKVCKRIESNSPSTELAAVKCPSLCQAAGYAYVNSITGTACSCCRPPTCNIKSLDVAPDNSKMAYQRCSALCLKSEGNKPNFTPIYYAESKWSGGSNCKCCEFH